MFMLYISLILVALILFMEFISRPMYYVTKLLRALGFGYLVYHSDSQKLFYATSRKDANEWMAATYGDSQLFDNRSKEALAIRFTK